MSRSTFEQLRLPAALLLIAIAVYALWPRDSGDAMSVRAAPSPSVIVGQPGGQVTPASAEPSPLTAIPTLSPPPNTESTPAPAQTEVQAPADDGFTADVLVCRSISGSSCNNELDNVPQNLTSITALVRFTDANGGDAINAILSGPGGTFDGGAYSLQGGGDGYYYATFGVQGLERGDYTVTATRNGDEVATTDFRKRGG